MSTDAGRELAVNRRHLMALSSMALLAGCLGEGDDPANESGGEAGGNGDGLGVSAADSYVAETVLTIEYPTEENLIIERDAEWDLANDRAAVTIDRRNPGQTSGQTMEWVIIEGTSYQIRSSGCVPFETETVQPDRIGDAILPAPDDEEFADGSTLQETTTRDGEPVEIWHIDFEGSTAINVGEMTTVIHEEHGYQLESSGWYSHRGSRDEAVSYEFEQVRHSFNEPLDIEAPTDC